jgi:hypothetical protein
MNRETDQEENDIWTDMRETSNSSRSSTAEKRACLHDDLSTSVPEYQFEPPAGLARLSTGPQAAQPDRWESASTSTGLHRWISNAHGPILLDILWHDCARPSFDTPQGDGVTVCHLSSHCLDDPAHQHLTPKCLEKGTLVSPTRVSKVSLYSIDTVRARRRVRQSGRQCS